MMARINLRINSLKEGTIYSLAMSQKFQNTLITEISERHPLLGNINIKHV
jgi:hypothetical protein